jgi:hypothetical protein
MPTYQFKLTQETAWLVVVAVLSTVLLYLSDLNSEGIADWQLWLTGLGLAVLRAGIAAFLAAIGPGGFVTK